MFVQGFSISTYIVLYTYLLTNLFTMAYLHSPSLYFTYLPAYTPAYLHSYLILYLLEDAYSPINSVLKRTALFIRWTWDGL